jgi:hypothetical protein
MRYEMTVDLIENDVVKTKTFHFSEERWLVARLQVITVLNAFYTDGCKLTTLYLGKNNLNKLKAGVYYSKVTIRGILGNADFNAFLFKKSISFDVLKKNLKMEKEMYQIFSNSKVLTEQVGLTKSKSVELLKGTNKLLHFYFK